MSSLMSERKSASYSEYTAFEVNKVRPPSASVCCAVVTFALVLSSGLG